MTVQAGGHIIAGDGQRFFHVMTDIAGLRDVAAFSQSFGAGLGPQNIVRIMAGSALTIILPLYKGFACVFAVGKLALHFTVALEATLSGEGRAARLIKPLERGVLRGFGNVSVTVGTGQNAVGRGVKTHLVNEP